MSHRLANLIEKARSIKMSASDKEEQRRSFAYGNTKIENPRITRPSINKAADTLAMPDGKKHQS